MKYISLEQINEFKNTYDSNPINKIIENAITNNGIQAVCLNQDALSKAKNVFNIEIPTYRVYDQTGSARCWCHAGINMIKNDISNNLNIKPEELDLSINYLIFFDKLEKSNNAYENIISLNNLDYDYINKENIVKYSVSEGGWFEWFVAVVDKYGIVPSLEMPETVNSKDSSILTMLFTEKVKKDVLELIKLRENGAISGVLREYKNKFLQENYNLLSKILGEPQENFKFEYKDRNGDYKVFNNLTPIEFKNKFLSIKLEDFVTIGNFPMYCREFNKVYKKKYVGSVYEDSTVKYLNLPIDNLKELTIKQLKDGLPVYMGAHIRKFRDTKSGILDTRLYNYEETINFKRLSKEEALNLYDIRAHHVMVFTGVNLIDEKPQRWKVEDSYGDKEKVNGYYIMNDNFFDEFVLSIVIDKKYLSEEQRELLNEEPIEFEIADPF